MCEPNEHQRENLRLLAQHLRKTRSRFSMETYAKTDTCGLDPIDVVHKCGTVCCAAGNGPKLAKKYPQFMPTNGEDWDDYSKRVYGTSSYGKPWCWLFHPNWEYVNNTSLGAAKRIEWYLVNGIPNDWKDQLCGQADLCYK